jgi:RNA polymerase sigma factor (sigma-70 family)
MAHLELDGIVRHLHRLAVSQATGELPDRQLLHRFAVHRDQAAFAALVQRHAALVWGVCRRVLHHEQDAEDALQASFLVLARQAATIRKAEALAGWLHGVAYRVAMTAKREAILRRNRANQDTTMPQADPQAEIAWRELQALLDEELQRLPEKYRVPFVLCCLEEKSRAEAASELGWKEGTVASRLAQARKLLQARLTRRGVTLAALLCSLALASQAPVSAALLVPVIRTAVSYASGQASAASGLSARVLSLAEGVTRAMLLGKMKIATALLLTVGILTASAAALAHPAPAPPQAQPSAIVEPAPANKPEKLARADASENQPLQLLITGRVVTANEKPVAGAQVALMVDPFYGIDGRDTNSRLTALVEADHQGTFRIALPQPRQDYQAMHLLVGHPHHTIARYPLPDPYAHRHEATIKLPRVPAQKVVTGRVVDVQGNAVAGALVSLWHNYPPEFARNIKYGPAPVTTNEQGRFRLTGIACDAEAWLIIQHDRYARQDVAVRVGADEVSAALSPARVVEGRVLYEDTGNPVANALLGSTGAPYAATELARVYVGRPDGQFTVLECVTVRSTGVRTDAQGRFRLVNCSDLMVFPPAGQPYLARHRMLDWPKAVINRQVEFKLERGILVRGKVTEAASGRAVAAAQLGYIQRRYENPLFCGGYSDTENFAAEGACLRYRSGPDGSFELVVPPGRGNLLVRAPTPDYWHVETTLWSLGVGIGSPVQRLYPDAVVPLDTKPGAGPLELAVKLNRGVTVSGRLLRPDGKPVGRAYMVCRWYLPVEFNLTYQHGLSIREGRFEVHGCDPETPHPAYFMDSETGCAATVQLGGKGMGPGPQTIRLLPSGSARMRFLDAKGKPVAGYRPYLELVLPRLSPAEKEVKPKDGHMLMLQNRLEGILPWDPKLYGHGGLATVATDAEGRITLSALIPGAPYRLSGTPNWSQQLKTFTVEPGKTLELGDIRTE